MINVRRASLCLAGAATLLAANGCSSPTINGFNLSSSASSVTLAPGTNAVLNIGSTGQTSAPVTAAIVFYSLPLGVSTTPASPTVATGSQTTIQFSASPQAPAGTSKVQIVGYSGLAYSTIYVDVTVTPAS